MTNCVGLLGQIFGHKYAPRLSEVETGRDIGRICVDSFDPDAMRRFMTLSARTYHGDVCERCGNLVNRQTRDSE